MKPVIAIGELSLFPVDPKIRDDGYVYYGWTNADLRSEDAPLCGGEPQ